MKPYLRDSVLPPQNYEEWQDDRESYGLDRGTWELWSLMMVNRKLHIEKNRITQENVTLKYMLKSIETHEVTKGVATPMQPGERELDPRLFSYADASPIPTEQQTDAFLNHTPQQIGAFPDHTPMQTDAFLHHTPQQIGAFPDHTPMETDAFPILASQQTDVEGFWGQN
ncbi:MAG: hypothetical protein Q9207_002184 [Kuettlingeria erythrocarpa]